MPIWVIESMALAGVGQRPVSVRTLNLDWRETDGPLVASPAHRGFGLQLLSRALEQFSGTVEMTFETSGLICRMKAMLSESKPSIVPDDQPSSPAAA